jgi:hypothetical protein
MDVVQDSDRVAAYENAELVEQFRGAVVITAAVLELAKLVQSIDHFRGDAVVLLEVDQVLDLVGAQVVDDLSIGEQVLDVGALVLQLLTLLEDLVALLGVLFRALVQVVDLGEQVADKVGHVGVLEQLELELGVLERRLVDIFLVLEELQQREDEMAVEVGDESGQDGLLLSSVGGSGHGCICARRGEWATWW